MQLGLDGVLRISKKCDPFDLLSVTYILVYTHTHTHTHAQNRFTALLEYVRYHPGEQVPER